MPEVIIDTHFAPGLIFEDRPSIHLLVRAEKDNFFVVARLERPYDVDFRCEIEKFLDQQGFKNLSVRYLSRLMVFVTDMPRDQFQARVCGRWFMVVQHARDFIASDPSRN